MCVGARGLICPTTLWPEGAVAFPPAHPSHHLDSAMWKTLLIIIVIVLFLLVAKLSGMVFFLSGFVLKLLIVVAAVIYLLWWLPRRGRDR